MYEALRFGTSLAQKAKRASGSESPHGNSVRNDYGDENSVVVLLYKTLLQPISHRYKNLISTTLSAQRLPHHHSAEWLLLCPPSAADLVQLMV